MDRRAPCGCDVMSLAAGQPHNLSCSTRIPRDGAIVGLATSGLASEGLRRISESIATGKPAGEVKGLATSGLASADHVSARDYVDGVEVRDLIAEAKDRAKLAQRAGMASEETSEHRPLGTGMQHQSAASTDDEDEYDPEGPGRSVVEQASEEIASGLSIVTLREFKVAARSLKAAELAFRDAQQVYAEAVKRLSEEAVK